MLTVSGKDARRSENIRPGWLAGKCTNFFTKPAQSDGSTVYFFEIEVEYNGLQYPLAHYVISEKAPSMGKNFFIACGLPAEKWEDLMKGDASITIDPASCVDKSFKVKVKNEIYDGRMSNKAEDFLPLS